MKLEQIQNLLSRPAGQYLSIEYERDCKVKKGSPTIRKHTRVNSRIGCRYDNLLAVKEKRESGELPLENQGLNGLEWLVYPTLLKNPKTGKIFLRIETIKNSIPKVIFTINGSEVKKSEIENFLYSSEKQSKESIDTYNVNIDDIIEVH